MHLTLSNRQRHYIKFRYESAREIRKVKVEGSTKRRNRISFVSYTFILSSKEPWHIVTSWPLLSNTKERVDA